MNLTGKQTSIDDKDAQSMVDDITNLGNTVNLLGPVQFLRWLRLVPKYNRFYRAAARIANRFNAVYEVSNLLPLSLGFCWSNSCTFIR